MDPDNADFISVCYEIIEASEALQALNPDDEKRIEKARAKIDKLETRYTELQEDMEFL